MDYQEIERIAQRVQENNGIVTAIREEMKKIIIGQDDLVTRLIITFLARGHILLEGLPGLAKTLTVRTFSRIVTSPFNRVQFTPDLLPSDLIGTRIFSPKDQEFFTRKGPIFTGILLADEVNRAPAKVQSALLQAMEEREVTIGEETHPLPDPFMVLATENPIEQEGTYPLPEAQLDRFFMKVLVGYPSIDEEREILMRHNNLDLSVLKPIIDTADLFKKAAVIDDIYVDDKLFSYIVALVNETRHPTSSDLKKYIEFGASPRASINLVRASRCLAFIKGRGFVTPDDIKEIGPDILRHRIVPSYEADARGTSADDLVELVFNAVEVP
jgi:MoxR-like ATPase